MKRPGVSGALFKDNAMYIFNGNSESAWCAFYVSISINQLVSWECNVIIYINTILYYAVTIGIEKAVKGM